MRDLCEKMGDPNAGPFTVFACVDSAFDRLASEEDGVKLRAMLRNGIVEGKMLTFS